nr:F-box protein At1g67340-like [Tanacetum cinerariifolium]
MKNKSKTNEEEALFKQPNQIQNQILIQRFLKRCSDSGNAEASYTLGMVRFYRLQNRRSGASCMAKAAIRSHAPALYSFAVIKFNGSGGMKNEKDLRARVALCARATYLGHIDRIRELGHCLQDGYGIKRNISEGWRLLIQADARELASNLSNDVKEGRATWKPLPHLVGPVCPLLSDFRCNVPAQEPHPANKFLFEWFKERSGYAQ